MLKENCIKILGSGLSYFKAAYKNVTLDIDQAEKNAKADSYTFSAEGFIPNSAEKYNLDLRAKYQVQCFDPSELTHFIRTRKFAYSYVQQILKTAEMLIKVLDLAKDINTYIGEIIKAEKRMKKDPKLQGEEKDFQIAKLLVNYYIEILLNIKTRISDITLQNAIIVSTGHILGLIHVSAVCSKLHTSRMSWQKISTGSMKTTLFTSSLMLRPKDFPELQPF